MATFVIKCNTSFRNNSLLLGMGGAGYPTATVTAGLVPLSDGLLHTVGLVPSGTNNGNTPYTHAIDVSGSLTPDPDYSKFTAMRVDVGIEGTGLWGTQYWWTHGGTALPGDPENTLFNVYDVWIIWDDGTIYRPTVVTTTPGTRDWINSDGLVHCEIEGFHCSGLDTPGNVRFSDFEPIPSGDYLAIDCDSPPDGIIGTAYSHSLLITGGLAPYTVTITSGGVPHGLSMDSSGVITGTPDSAGTYPFTALVTDYDGFTASVSCSITVAPASPLAIDCNSPPSGTVGTSYDHLLSATGGSPPYAFSITSGSLPTSLTLNPGTGRITGTPTAAGTFSFTVQVEDIDSELASVSCSITISAASPSLDITCGSPPSGEVTIPYTHTFPVTGGTAPYTVSLIGGSIPPGLTLSGSTRVISGTPTTAGTFSFTLRAADSASHTDTVSCSITITAPPSPVHIDCNSPPPGVVGTPYTHAFTVTGETMPYTVEIYSGGLPPGLILHSDGTVTGTPLVPGIFPVALRVVDARGVEATVICSIGISLAGGGTGTCMWLELYVWRKLETFDSLTDTVQFPHGYQKALQAALAVELAVQFKGSAPANVLAIAAEATQTIARLNLANEAAQEG